MQTQHDNNPNIPIISWASDRFLACEPKQLQHKFFAQQMQSLHAQLLNTSSPSDKLRLHSCSGTGAAAFLRVPASYPGCFFTNQEFIIAIKIRIKAPCSFFYNQHAFVARPSMILVTICSSAELAGNGITDTQY